MVKSHKKKVQTPKDQKPLTPQSREIPPEVDQDELKDELIGDILERPPRPLPRASITGKNVNVTVKDQLAGFPFSYTFTVPLGELEQALDQLENPSSLDVPDYLKSSIADQLFLVLPGDCGTRG